MNQKTELEVQKAAILKAIRSTIRLKYSLLADKELNDKLPEVERMIDDALQSGNAISFNPAFYLEH